jgi:hypothetical protein
MPMQLSSELPFDFAHLVDVQPFLSTARDGDFALTIDSIERYEHGFVLVLWAEAAVGPLYLFAISATDDVGSAYPGLMVSGYGGGGQDGWHNRIVYAFMPALDPEARSLMLNVTHARRIRHERMRDLGMLPEGEIGGPWLFSFDLTQPGAPGQALTIPRPDTGSSVDESPARPSTLPSTMSHIVAHGPEGFVPLPRYEPSQLQRVIAVAQQQEVERFAITILSLESYTDGFCAVVRTDYPAPSMRLPHPLHWQAVDDLGGQYWPRGAPGSGHGRPDHATTWRVDCQFTPALNPEARVLRLWLDEVEFKDAPFGTARPAKPVVISGRWEFVISL